MKKAIMKRIVPAAFSAALCFGWICNSLSAVAEVRLPDGTAAGLPEKLTVMDSDGNSVSSETGEYFFYVEDMQPNVDYSKNIQIMNLREDKAYHIYFYAEPIAKSGEIDLENNCTAVFTLDNQKVFQGKVTGEASDGSINLSEEPIDLGTYAPGQSRNLNCTITWDGENVDEFIDYGEKLVDADGVHIIREGDEDAYIEGEVTFRWIFYAAVDEEYTPPKTGAFDTQPWIYLLLIGVLAVLIAVMAAAIWRKKRKTAAMREEK